jgi:hypothetical protein
MEGNPNELDMFICRECNKTGNQAFFFKKDEEGNVLLDSDNNPMLECPSSHENRNNVVQLPAT